MNLLKKMRLRLHMAITVFSCWLFLATRSYYSYCYTAPHSRLKVLERVEIHSASPHHADRAPSCCTGPADGIRTRKPGRTATESFIAVGDLFFYRSSLARQSATCFFDDNFSRRDFAYSCASGWTRELHSYSASKSRISSGAPNGTRKNRSTTNAVDPVLKPMIAKTKILPQLLDCDGNKSMSRPEPGLREPDSLRAHYLPTESPPEPKAGPPRFFRDQAFTTPLSSNVLRTTTILSAAYQCEKGSDVSQDWLRMCGGMVSDLLDSLIDDDEATVSSTAAKTACDALSTSSLPRCDWLFSCRVTIAKTSDGGGARSRYLVNSATKPRSLSASSPVSRPQDRPPLRINRRAYVYVATTAPSRAYLEKKRTDEQCLLQARPHIPFGIVQDHGAAPFDQEGPGHLPALRVKGKHHFHNCQSCALASGGGIMRVQPVSLSGSAVVLIPSTHTARRPFVRDFFRPSNTSALRNGCCSEHHKGCCGGATDSYYVHLAPSFSPTATAFATAGAAHANVDAGPTADWCRGVHAWSRTVFEQIPACTSGEPKFACAGFAASSSRLGDCLTTATRRQAGRATASPGRKHELPMRERPVTRLRNLLGVPMNATQQHGAMAAPRQQMRQRAKHRPRLRLYPACPDESASTTTGQGAAAAREYYLHELPVVYRTRTTTCGTACAGGDVGATSARPKTWTTRATTSPGLRTSFGEQTVYRGDVHLDGAAATSTTRVFRGSQGADAADSTQAAVRRPTRRRVARSTKATNPSAAAVYRRLVDVERYCTGRSWPSNYSQLPNMPGAAVKNFHIARYGCNTLLQKQQQTYRDHVVDVRTRLAPGCRDRCIPPSTKQVHTARDVSSRSLVKAERYPQKGAHCRLHILRAVLSAPPTATLRPRWPSAYDTVTDYGGRPDGQAVCPLSSLPLGRFLRPRSTSTPGTSFGRSRDVLYKNSAAAQRFSQTISASPATHQPVSAVQSGLPTTDQSVAETASATARWDVGHPRFRRFPECRARCSGAFQTPVADKRTHAFARHAFGYNGTKAGCTSKKLRRGRARPTAVTGWGLCRSQSDYDFGSSSSDGLPPPTRAPCGGASTRGHSKTQEAQKGAPLAERSEQDRVGTCWRTRPPAAQSRPALTPRMEPRSILWQEEVSCRGTCATTCKQKDRLQRKNAPLGQDGAGAPLEVRLWRRAKADNVETLDFDEERQSLSARTRPSFLSLTKPSGSFGANNSGVSSCSTAPEARRAAAMLITANDCSHGHGDDKDSPTAATEQIAQVSASMTLFSSPEAEADHGALERNCAHHDHDQRRQRSVLLLASCGIRHRLSPSLRRLRHPETNPPTASFDDMSSLHLLLRGKSTESRPCLNTAPCATVRPHEAQETLNGGPTVRTHSCSDDASAAVEFDAVRPEWDDGLRVVIHSSPGRINYIFPTGLHNFTTRNKSNTRKTPSDLEVERQSLMGRTRNFQSLTTTAHQPLLLVFTYRMRMGTGLLSAKRSALTTFVRDRRHLDIATSLCWWSEKTALPKCTRRSSNRRNDYSSGLDAGAGRSCSCILRNKKVVSRTCADSERHAQPPALHTASPPPPPRIVVAVTAVGQNCHHPLLVCSNVHDRGSGSIRGVLRKGCYYRNKMRRRLAPTTRCRSRHTEVDEATATRAGDGCIPVSASLTPEGRCERVRRYSSSASYIRFGEGKLSTYSRGSVAMKMSVLDHLQEMGSGLLLRSAAWFGSSIISVFDYMQLDSCLSIQKSTRIASDFSVYSKTQIRSCCPVPDAVSCFGSSLSIRALARLGGATTVLDAVHLSPTLSVRGVCRFGRPFSIFSEIVFGSPLSVLDCVNFGSPMSVRSLLRIGSALSEFVAETSDSLNLRKLSTLANISIGSGLSLRGFEHFGSSFTIYNRATIGFNMSTLDWPTLGSTLSIRRMCRAGSATAVFGEQWRRNCMSILDLSMYGSNMSLRGFARIGFAFSIFISKTQMRSLLSVLDFASLGSTTSTIRSILRLGSSFPVVGLDNGFFLRSQLSVLDFANCGSSISVRSMIRFGSTLSIFSRLLHGSTLPVLNIKCANLGSSVSMGSAIRLGSLCSIFERVQMSSSMAIVDFLALGSSLSLVRAVATFGSSFSVTGSFCSDESPCRRKMEEPLSAQQLHAGRQSTTPTPLTFFRPPTTASADRSKSRSCPLITVAKRGKSGTGWHGGVSNENGLIQKFFSSCSGYCSVVCGAPSARDGTLPVPCAKVVRSLVQHDAPCAEDPDEQLLLQQQTFVERKPRDFGVERRTSGGVRASGFALLSLRGCLFFARKGWRRRRGMTAIDMQSHFLRVAETSSALPSKLLSRLADNATPELLAAPRAGADLFAAAHCEAEALSWASVRSRVFLFAAAKTKWCGVTQCGAKENRHRSSIARFQWTAVCASPRNAKVGDRVPALLLISASLGFPRTQWSRLQLGRLSQCLHTRFRRLRQRSSEDLYLFLFLPCAASSGRFSAVLLLKLFDLMLTVAEECENAVYGVRRSKSRDSSCSVLIQAEEELQPLILALEMLTRRNQSAICYLGASPTEPCFRRGVDTSSRHSHRATEPNIRGTALRAVDVWADELGLALDFTPRARTPLRTQLVGSEEFRMSIPLPLLPMAEDRSALHSPRLEFYNLPLRMGPAHLVFAITADTIVRTIVSTTEGPGISSRRVCFYAASNICSRSERELQRFRELLVLAGVPKSTQHATAGCFASPPAHQDKWATRARGVFLSQRRGSKSDLLSLLLLDQQQGSNIYARECRELPYEGQIENTLQTLNSSTTSRRFFFEEDFVAATCGYSSSTVAQPHEHTRSGLNKTTAGFEVEERRRSILGLWPPKITTRVTTASRLVTSASDYCDACAHPHVPDDPTNFDRPTSDDLRSPVFKVERQNLTRLPANLRASNFHTQTASRNSTSSSATFYDARAHDLDGPAKFGGTRTNALPVPDSEVERRLFFSWLPEAEAAVCYRCGDARPLTRFSSSRSQAGGQLRLLEMRPVHCGTISEADSALQWTSKPRGTSALWTQTKCDVNYLRRSRSQTRTPQDQCRSHEYETEIPVPAIGMRMPRGMTSETAGRLVLGVSLRHLVLQAPFANLRPFRIPHAHAAKRYGFPRSRSCSERQKLALTLTLRRALELRGRRGETQSISGGDHDDAAAAGRSSADASAAQTSTCFVASDDLPFLEQHQEREAHRQQARPGWEACFFRSFDLHSLHAIGVAFSACRFSWSAAPHSAQGTASICGAESDVGPDVAVAWEVVIEFRARVASHSTFGRGASTSAPERSNNIESHSKTSLVFETETQLPGAGSVASNAPAEHERVLRVPAPREAGELESSAQRQRISVDVSGFEIETDDTEVAVIAPPRAMKFASQARTPQETQTEQDHSAAPSEGSEDLPATRDDQRADTCTRPPEAPTQALTTTQTKHKLTLLQRMRAVSDPTAGSLALLDFGEERQTSNAWQDFPSPTGTKVVGPKSVHRPTLTRSGEAGAADDAGLFNSAYLLLLRLRSAPSNDVVTGQIVAGSTPVEVAVDISSLHDHRRRFTTNRGRTRPLLLESKFSRVARNDQGPTTSSPDDSALVTWKRHPVAALFGPVSFRGHAQLRQALLSGAGRARTPSQPSGGTLRMRNINTTPQQRRDRTRARARGPKLMSMSTRLHTASLPGLDFDHVTATTTSTTMDVVAVGPRLLICCAQLLAAPAAREGDPAVAPAGHKLEAQATATSIYVKGKWAAPRGKADSSEINANRGNGFDKFVEERLLIAIAAGKTTRRKRQTRTRLRDAEKGNEWKRVDLDMNSDTFDGHGMDSRALQDVDSGNFDGFGFQFNGAEQMQKTSEEWMQKKHNHRATTRAKKDRWKRIQGVWHPSDPILPGEAVGKSTCRAAEMAPARRVSTTRIGSGLHLDRVNSACVQ